MPPLEWLLADGPWLPMSRTFCHGSRTSHSHFYPLARPFPCPEGSWRKEALWLCWCSVFASSDVFGNKDTAYAAQSKEKRDTAARFRELYNFSGWDNKIHCWVHQRHRHLLPYGAKSHLHPCTVVVQSLRSTKSSLHQTALVLSVTKLSSK